MTTGVTPVEYQWKPGASIKIAPDVAGRELERLTKRDGEVIPIKVVEENRAPDAPLHEHFEWNDPAAADAWREDQAKHLIRSLVVVHVRNDTEEPLPPVRAYVSVVDEPVFNADIPRVSATRHYRPIARVMSDQDLRDQYRKQAFDTLCSFRDRYADIEDFSRIFQEIDKLREQYS